MGADQPLTRRRALAALAALPGAAPALVGLRRPAPRPVAGGYVDEAGAGHALRDGRRPAAPARRERVPILIVGGGVGGLAAGWALDRAGVRDWLLLEAEREPGGNARAGETDGLRYPWGAHYLPVPGPAATDLRALCTELGLLADGRWDERALVHAPQERLFRHGTWHEGLEPTFALDRAERAQFARFAALVDEWRATGAFTIPSLDGRARGGAAAAALDGQSMAAWLDAHRFTSPALRWSVEYAVRDDYGASLATASAWAGLHYFAARDGDEGPLTWPEGNQWLVARLAARAGARLRTGAPAWRIARAGTRWVVDTAQVRYEADALVAALPVFVLARLLDGVAPPPVTLERSPWLVANVHLDRWPEERGLPVAWDNVAYDSPSLGYVVATHQSLRTAEPRTVWTWYEAPVHDPPAIARRRLRDTPWPAVRDRVLADLRRMHPDIDRCVTRIDVMRYAHAMARPVPGVLAATERLRAWRPGPRFALAHADATGLSLFEEAFERGVAAARTVRAGLGA